MERSRNKSSIIYITIIIIITILLAYIGIKYINIKKNDDDIIRQGKEITEKEDDDEILNEKAKEPVSDSIKYSSFFTLSEDISKREARRKVDCNIVIGKVKKIISSSNVNKDSKEETHIITKAELEILDVLKGDLKEKSVIIKNLVEEWNIRNILKEVRH